MLIVSLIVSAVYLLIVNRIARRQSHLGTPSFLSLPACLFGFPFACFPAFAFGSFATAVAGFICIAKGLGPRAFLRCSVTAMALSHIGVSFFSIKVIQQNEGLRERFPVENLASRLPPPSAKVADLLDGAAVNLDDGQLDAFEWEVNAGFSFRTSALAYLHAGVVADFISSPGFGVTRMSEGYSRGLELPEVDSIPFSPLQYELPDLGDKLTTASATTPGTASHFPPANDSLRLMHLRSTVDFVNKKGFGYFIDREHVRGFQPHGLREVPKVEEPASKQHRWLIKRVELVSLIMHDEPVVYVSKNLPRMQELRGASTRPLTAFEKGALERLGTGDDLKVSSSPNHIQLVGAIRAVKQCLNCHDARRGDLLGAFSYLLERSTSAADVRD